MENQYDRQIRLWGTLAQQRLAESKIICLGTTLLATETLKNVILAGIKQIVFIDDTRVTLTDVAHNFFLNSSDLHHSRARCLANALKKLNTTVQISFLNQNVENFTAFLPTLSFETFHILLVTVFPSLTFIERLEQFCSTTNLRILTVQSFHMTGLLQNIGPDHLVYNLGLEKYYFKNYRFMHPFNELNLYMDQLENKLSLGHPLFEDVPYAAFIFLALHAFTKTKKTVFTPNHSNRQWIRTWIDNAIITTPLCVYENQLKEALKYMDLLLPDDNIPKNLLNLITYCNKHGFSYQYQSEHPTDMCEDDRYRLCITALTQFYNELKRLPTYYNANESNLSHWNEMFKKEALQDFHRFKSILLSLVQQRMESPQRTSTASHKTVTCTTLPLLGFTDTFLEKFYQEYTRMDLVLYNFNNKCSDIDAFTFLEDECDKDESTQTSRQCIPKESPMNMLILQKFLPMITNISLNRNQKIALLESCMKQLGFHTCRRIHEGYLQKRWINACSTEQPLSAAFLGGLCSQEIFKILTHHFVPLTNTLCWNGYSNETLILQHSSK